MCKIQELQTTEITHCRSLLILAGICFVCQFGINILVFGLTRTVGLSLKSEKSKFQLKSTAETFNLSTEGTIFDLRNRIENHLKNVKQTRPHKNELYMNEDIQPGIITKAAEDMMFCSSDANRLVYLISIKADGVGYKGYAVNLCTYPNQCSRILDLCCSETIYMLLVKA